MTPPITADGVEGVKKLVGQEAGPTDWVEVTQDMVNLFADATGDHQWIHIDVERAKKESPFGGPVAHGYLTLSLGPVLYPQVAVFKGFKMGVNYGANKIRFMSPVPVGANLRLGVKVLAVDDIPGGIQNTMEFTFEIEGAAKPACVAELIFRSYV